ncbi:AI-2E family transporter [Fischerella sp. PCC 9605]|uniref:AI-2E family transporter n=1 Tax=Fischerella sp. PCC 9605 TaxID=1173024 RepID=UPI0004BA1AD6|nr:AI-2E family transporter [Fischerella sp. PCC 9605]
MTDDKKLPRWLNLGLVFPIIFVNGWLLLLLCQYLQPIVSTVFTASLIAFLINYPIVFLEERGVKRGWAIGLVLLLTLLLFAVIGLVLGPLVFQQLVEFGDRVPAWIEAGRQQLQAWDEQTVLQQLPIDFSTITTQLTSQLTGAMQSFTSQIINVTLDTINSALNVVLTLVLTIFLVLYGESVWNGILSWLPSEWNHQIQSSLKQSFQNYFAGQAIVATILSAIMILAFLVLQIPFGLLFGLGIGIASLIPFGGVVSITLVSLLVAFQNIWLGVKVLVVAIILGQINENFIAPRLIGGITGLNPAWVFISLLLGAKFAGILGLLMAVPTASFIKKTADSLRTSDLKFG